MKLNSKQVSTTHYILDLDSNEAYSLYHWLLKSTVSEPDMGEAQRRSVKAILESLANEFEPRW
ncbi:hypothetical protein PBI_GRAYSON_17 [Rhodococcus phage Grayson]|nr:hypothetical protein PBI_GRAYSON_17 [Rhodococcus phage Grayson]